MSLDVYLEIDGHSEPEREAIFVREDGHKKELSREEWNALNPGREAATCIVGGESNEVYSANITHNLNTMAEAAGIYKHLWRPDEINITKAEQLIEPLTIGLRTLVDSPETFKVHNPPNGWGSYEGRCG